MRLKPNLKLRKMGSRHMIVDSSTGHVSLTNVFTLNDTATCMWQRAIQGDFTPEDLADAVCQDYDVTPEQALADAQELTSQWLSHGLAE